MRKEEQAKKISSTIEGLRKRGGGFCETTFWEFKRKLEGGRHEEMKVINNENGKKVDEKEEVVKVYHDFYQKLFEKSKPKDTVAQEVTGS